MKIIRAVVKKCLGKKFNFQVITIFNLITKRKEPFFKPDIQQIVKYTVKT